MSSGATAGLHIDRRFTTLELIGTRDCGDVYGDGGNKTAALVVWGGAFINKTACIGELNVSGDAVIQGNLIVLGSKIVEEAECLVVENQYICLGNVRGGTPTDLTANAGGILLRSVPGHTKSWLWIKDIGSSGAWNSNQDINIGGGRLAAPDSDFGCPSCGLDSAISGTTYRIDGLPVLTLTELGNTVVTSSLQSVGTLRQGAIDSSSTIVSTLPGNPTTCVQTAQAHGFVTGDQVFISGSNTSPPIDGCYAVTVTSPNTFCIQVATTGAGSVGFVNGPTFPIDIGTSPFWSGTHTINCANDLIVMNASETPCFYMSGTNQQLQITNTVSPNFAQCISNTFLGGGSLQRALWVKNQSNSTTVPSTTVATDIQQLYSGTSTLFNDNEFTLQSAGQRIVMTVSPQVLNPKISSRGLDVTSAALFNNGSNVGVFSEAGGPIGCTLSAGVMGFSNPNTGIFQVGVYGCANMTRQTVANEINAIVVGGGTTVGGYFCNPNTGPNDWALCTEGRTKFAGNVYVLGNLSVSDLSVLSTVSLNNLEAQKNGNIQVFGNLNPGSAGFSLGNASAHWQLAYIDKVIAPIIVTGNIQADEVKANTIVATTGDIENLVSTVAYIDELFVTSEEVNHVNANVVIGNLACFKELQVDEIVAKNRATQIITVDGSLIPSLNRVYDLGDNTNQWAHGYFYDVQILNELLVLGNATYINSNVVLVQDNFITVNSPPQFDNCDSGLMVQRYQIANDTGAGDVVSNGAPQDSGHLQSATTNTAVLAASEPITSEYYQYWWIKMVSGAALNEVRYISDYNGITKTATLAHRLDPRSSKR